jgi:hypothetical protein
MNLATMVGKFGHDEVFITTKEEGLENAYQLDATKDSSNSGDEVEAAIALLNFVGTFQVILAPAPTT